MRSALILPLVLAGASALAQKSTPPPKVEKQICKRYADIGTLIPNRKECHTRAEWDQLAADNRANAQADADRRLGGSPQGQ